MATAEQEHFIPESQKDVAGGAEDRLLRYPASKPPQPLSSWVASASSSVKRDNQSDLPHKVQSESFGPLLIKHLLCAGP